MESVIYGTGEEIKLDLVFRNIGSDSIIVTPFPPVIQINRADTGDVVRSFPEGDERRKISPSGTLSYTLAWKQLDDKGEHHRARLKYKEAVRIDERCTPAYLFIGDSYVLENRLEEAVTFWKKLIEIVPEYAYLTFERLEKAHFELGDFSAVVRVYQDLISRRPNDLRALFALVPLPRKALDRARHRASDPRSEPVGGAYAPPVAVPASSDRTVGRISAVLRGGSSHGSRRRVVVGFESASRSARGAGGEGVSRFRALTAPQEVYGCRSAR